jgi:hypothetical protein
MTVGAMVLLAHMPLFLLTVFAKNEKDNLSAKEQADLVETSKRIIAAYGDRQCVKPMIGSRKG